MIKGKFLPDTPMYEYHSVSSGETHKPFSKNNEFLGDTKGNKDLPTNRTANTPGGYGGGQHKAGGSGKKMSSKKMDY